MKKNYFLKFSFLLFISILLLNSCKVTDEDIQQETKQNTTVNIISFEQFNKLVKKTADLEELTRSSDFNKSTSKTPSNSGDTIITNEIISIEKEGFTSYTFGIENSGDDILCII